jgi:hypothetical protein
MITCGFSLLRSDSRSVAATRRNAREAAKLPAYPVEEELIKHWEKSNPPTEDETMLSMKRMIDEVALTSRSDPNLN